MYLFDQNIYIPPKVGRFEVDIRKLISFTGRFPVVVTCSSCMSYIRQISGKSAGECTRSKYPIGTFSLKTVQVHIIHCARMGSQRCDCDESPRCTVCEDLRVYNQTNRICS